METQRRKDRDMMDRLINRGWLLIAICTLNLVSLTTWALTR
jgi:hypothetical protein